MKNRLLTIAIIIIVLIIIFGILYGWFRKKDELTQEEIDALNKINYNPSPLSLQNVTDAKSLFSQLWYDHVRLTREVIVATFNNDPNVKDLEEKLLKNQEDIGNAIDKYYPNSASLITKLLKEHILQAKTILEDLKYKRLGRLSHDINVWYANSDKFSEVMEMINPKWQLKSHMAEHLRITEREALYEWSGAKKTSLDIYNERIIPNAQEMANVMSDGILNTTQFPSNPKGGDTFVKDGVGYTWMCIQLNSPINGRPATCDWYKDEYIKSLNLVG